MGRRIWRGLRDRGAPALTRPVGPGCAGGGGLGVLVVIFILENQLESHLLQPLVVGRMVRFHPLAIILLLAVGGVAGGIAGAVVAVPTAAALFRAVPCLLGRRPATADGADPPGPPPGAG